MLCIILNLAQWIRNFFWRLKHSLQVKSWSSVQVLAEFVDCKEVTPIEQTVFLIQARCVRRWLVPWNEDKVSFDRVQQDGRRVLRDLVGHAQRRLRGHTCCLHHQPLKREFRRVLTICPLTCLWIWTAFIWHNFYVSGAFLLKFGPFLRNALGMWWTDGPTDRRIDRWFLFPM